MVRVHMLLDCTLKRVDLESALRHRTVYTRNGIKANAWAVRVDGWLGGRRGLKDLARSMRSWRDRAFPVSP